MSIFGLVRNFSCKIIVKKNMRIGLAMSIFFLSVISYAQTLRPWMHPDVENAWKQGYKGQGTTILIIDNFYTYGRFPKGKLDDHKESLKHGEWTLKQANMIAPAAIIKNLDHTDSSSTPTVVTFNSDLNIFNLSFMIPVNFSKSSQIEAKNHPDDSLLRIYSGFEINKSVIDFAKNGKAIISKSAGNDGIAMGSPNSSGEIDYLALVLKETPSTLFVGALSSNGTTLAPATMASYSNTAGADPNIQKRFLVVGVKCGGLISLAAFHLLGLETGNTGLKGTSFAAPIISGYAAILGSKFTQATPIQITHQLLNTARQDTVKNYRPEIYGQGEASLSRALAPISVK